MTRAGREKTERRELPILTHAELCALVDADGDARLMQICADDLLLRRAIDYLEAVGDVMCDQRLDALLLDPVGWFATFLAHFIRDDGNPPAEVVRGVVALADVVAALRHEYAAPETQVRRARRAAWREEGWGGSNTLMHPPPDPALPSLREEESPSLLDGCPDVGV